jgi:hypothetical protein
MKTTRSRILIVVIAASVVVSILMNWTDFERGYRAGRSSGRTYWGHQN